MIVNGWKNTNQPEVLMHGELKVKMLHLITSDTRTRTRTHTVIAYSGLQKPYYDFT